MATLPTVDPVAATGADSNAAAPPEFFAGLGAQARGMRAFAQKSRERDLKAQHTKIQIQIATSKQESAERELLADKEQEKKDEAQRIAHTGQFESASSEWTRSIENPEVVTDTWLRQQMDTWTPLLESDNYAKIASEKISQIAATGIRLDSSKKLDASLRFEEAQANGNAWANTEEVPEDISKNFNLKQIQTNKIGPKDSGIRFMKGGMKASATARANVKIGKLAGGRLTLEEFQDDEDLQELLIQDEALRRRATNTVAALIKAQGEGGGDGGAVVTRTIGETADKITIKGTLEEVNAAEGAFKAKQESDDLANTDVFQNFIDNNSEAQSLMDEINESLDRFRAGEDTEEDFFSAFDLTATEDALKAMDELNEMITRTNGIKEEGDKDIPLFKVPEILRKGRQPSASPQSQPIVNESVASFQDTFKNIRSTGGVDR